jgi:hypothetical protein
LTNFYSKFQKCQEKHSTLGAERQNGQTLDRLGEVDTKPVPAAELRWEQPSGSGLGPAGQLAKLAAFLEGREDFAHGFLGLFAMEFLAGRVGRIQECGRIVQELVGENNPHFNFKMLKKF